jgi:LysM repeat protein
MTFRAVSSILLLTALAACAGYQAPAPVDDRTERAAVRPAVRAAEVKAQEPQPAAADGYYVVKKGDTLYSIALDNGADYRELAQWNALDDPTKLRIGQVLRVIPPAEPAAVVTVSPARGVAAPETKPIGAPPVVATTVKPQAAIPEPAAQFVWPAKGRVLAGFSEPRSKGIDIDGKLGDPVVAAAAGRVLRPQPQHPGEGAAGGGAGRAHRRARLERRRPPEAAFPDPQGLGPGRPVAVFAGVLKIGVRARFFLYFSEIGLCPRFTCSCFKA